MKNLLKLITNKRDQVYYDFRCDDRRKGDEIPTDKSFCLSEVVEINNLLNKCNEPHLNYDLVIVEWDESEQSIDSELYIVGNNSKNNQNLKL